MVPSYHFHQSLKIVRNQQNPITHFIISPLKITKKTNQTTKSSNVIGHNISSSHIQHSPYINTLIILFPIILACVQTGLKTLILAMEILKIHFTVDYFIFNLTFPAKFRQFV